jgi:hypothetical protein
MDRPGSKRVVGVALVATGAGIVLLSGLSLVGVLPFFAPDSRPVLGTVFLVAGVLDGIVGFKLLKTSD